MHFPLTNFSGPLTECSNISWNGLNPNDSCLASRAENIKNSKPSSQSFCWSKQYVFIIILRVEWNLSSAPYDCGWYALTCMEVIPKYFNACWNILNLKFDPCSVCISLGSPNWWRSNQHPSYFSISEWNSLQKSWGRA